MYLQKVYDICIIIKGRKLNVVVAKAPITSIPKMSRESAITYYTPRPLELKNPHTSTMAENIPPAADNTRGVPYYEKLKRDLRDTLHKKRLLDKNMVSLSL